jgi:predicted flavoprotein YhiN
MKSLTLDPGDPRPFSEAVVAAGGIDTDGINPATMESRVVPGLFITGEVLDIDGDSGGYNLQFAWSTGAVAGMAQA